MFDADLNKIKRILCVCLIASVTGKNLPDKAPKPTYHVVLQNAVNDGREKFHNDLRPWTVLAVLNKNINKYTVSISYALREV